MAKRPLRIPDRSEVTDDTPLQLEIAARLAFPDGSISGLALRNAAYRGELEHERIGSRVLTTLRWIREFRERNRHPATRAPAIREEHAKKLAERQAQERGGEAVRKWRMERQKAQREQTALAPPRSKRDE